MFLILSIIYALGLLFVPWIKIFPGLGDFATYGFDILFIVLSLIIFKIKPPFDKVPLKKCFIPFLLPIILAILSIYYLYVTKTRTPFSLVGNLFIQAVCFAPLFEELVFRVILLKTSVKLLKNNKVLIVIINSVLFSLNHALALQYIPKVFYNFIYVQIVYTLILGIILSLQIIKRENFLFPYLSHLIFNILFYLAFYLGLFTS